MLPYHPKRLPPSLPGHGSSASAVHADLRFIPEPKVLPLLRGMRSYPRDFSLFFVENGASIIVESTIVPYLPDLSFRPKLGQHRSKDLLLQIVLLRDWTETSQCISVRDLISRGYTAEGGEGSAAGYLIPCPHIRQIIQHRNRYRRIISSGSCGLFPRFPS